MIYLDYAANTPVNEDVLENFCEVSRPVYALTKDKKAALSTLRISLSHLTPLTHIEIFLDCFDECYRKFIK